MLDCCVQEYEARFYTNSLSSLLKIKLRKPWKIRFSAFSMSEFRIGLSFITCKVLLPSAKLEHLGLALQLERCTLECLRWN